MGDVIISEFCCHFAISPTATALPVGKEPRAHASRPLTCSWSCTSMPSVIHALVVRLPTKTTAMSCFDCACKHAPPSAKVCTTCRAPIALLEIPPCALLPLWCVRKDTNCHAFLATLCGFFIAQIVLGNTTDALLVMMTTRGRHANEVFWRDDDVGSHTNEMKIKLEN